MFARASPLIGPVAAANSMRNLSVSIVDAFTGRMRTVVTTGAGHDCKGKGDEEEKTFSPPGDGVP